MSVDHKSSQRRHLFTDSRPEVLFDCNVRLERRAKNFKHGDLVWVIVRVLLPLQRVGRRQEVLNFVTHSIDVHTQTRNKIAVWSRVNTTAHSAKRYCYVERRLVRIDSSTPTPRRQTQELLLALLFLALLLRHGLGRRLLDGGDLIRLEFQRLALVGLDQNLAVGFEEFDDFALDLSFLL